MWLFRVALVALYYGRFAYARNNVLVAITDGDDDMIVALSGVILRGQPPRVLRAAMAHRRRSGRIRVCALYR
jgi:hypothetical protein